MPLEWKDTTSYSRSDNAQRPTTWTARAGEIRISVVRGHINHPGAWVLIAEPFYHERELHVVDDLDDIAGAQALAVQLVRARLEEALDAL